MSKSDTEVVIVGGGAAGIAAGRRLHEAGVDCLVVEARPRLGGRAWTVADSNGLPIDLGCGWLHSANRNPWTKIAEAQGHIVDRSPPPWARPLLAGTFPLADQRAYVAAMDAFHDRVSLAAQKEKDVALSALLEPGNRWNGMIGTVMSFITGGELDRVSARDLDNYADSNVNWRVVEGYGTTITAYAGGVPVALGCPVRRIDHHGQRLRIETAQGTITASRAIVTLPTSLLAATPDFFSPGLPEKTEAAANLPLGLADKLFLSFERADEFDRDTRVMGHFDRRMTAGYNVRPLGRPQIECYFGGQLAADLEAGGEGAFLDFALSELNRHFGTDFAKRLRPIQGHHWGADPFARGSYSYALPGMADCRERLAAPVEERLFFAGEACLKHDFSTAHGGFLSGVAAAEALIAARRQKPF